MQAAPVNLQQLIKLKSVCRDLVNDSKDIASLNELGHLVEGIDERLINAVQPLIFSVFYPMLKNIAKDKASYSNKEKEVIVEILSSLFKKSNINNISLFFNFYSFLLFELYDHLHHTVLEINEEYKLAIMKCTTNLAKSLASDLILTVYSKENAPKLCQMIYVAMEIAKNEKMRSLRVAAMECIMSLGRVLDDGELEDVVVGKSIAQVFLYFLPGLASGLKQIALEDEKVGHYVTQVALKAWGRIITLLLQDYNPADNKYDIDLLKNKSSHEIDSITSALPEQKFKNKQGITEYLENVKHGAQWYSETDKRLQLFAAEFMKITNHSRREVKIELTHMCQIIVENCLTTIPRTVCNLIEIIISMSENEDNEIRSSNQIFLDRLSNELSADIFSVLFETLEEGFLNGLNKLPRKMNSIDCVNEARIKENINSELVEKFSFIKNSTSMTQMTNLRLLILENLSTKTLLVLEKIQNLMKMANAIIRQAALAVQPLEPLIGMTNNVELNNIAPTRNENDESPKKLYASLS